MLRWERNVWGTFPLFLLGLKTLRQTALLKNPYLYMYTRVKIKEVNKNFEDCVKRI